MPVDGQSYDNTSKIEKTDSYKVLKEYEISETNQEE